MTSVPPTSPDTTEALLSAYRQTRYRVCLPGHAAVEIRVGIPAPNLDVALERARTDAWAFVTAHNPGPRRLSHAINARRNVALRRAARRFYLSAWPAVGIGHSGGPTEPGFVFLGASAHAARTLGRAFGQLAVLHGRRGAPVQLLHLS